MGILQLIASRNFITVNKDIIKILGIDEAILIGELASEYDYWEKQDKLEDGFFYSTIENIEENTTLSEFKQRKALNKLKQLGIVEIKVKGIPAKRYLKINEDQLFKLFNCKFLKNSGTGTEKNKELDNKKLNGNNNINNNNKNNNNKESKKISFDELIDTYTNNEELRQELKNHLATRKSKKATLTNRAIELSFKRLDELTKDVPVNETEEIKIKIVQQSIERGWIGFFDLPKDTKNKSGNSNNGWDFINDEFNQIKQNNIM